MGMEKWRGFWSGDASWRRTSGVIENAPMLNWWYSLGLRGKLVFWGGFGLAVNGLIFFLDLWMPILLFVSIGLLVLALFVKSEDSTDL